MSVGRSWRTYGKHEMISSFLGQEVGVVNSMSARTNIERVVWLDLTAGDAITPEDGKWHKNCSPGLLAHHAVNLDVDAWIRLYEIQASTYERLLTTLDSELPQWGFTRRCEGTWTAPTRNGSTVRVDAVHGSGSHADVSMIDSTDAVIVLNDPNAITEWAMTPSMTREIARRTKLFRSLSTLGCNPAGLKRLKLEERMQWFGLLQVQEDILPPYRDLLLAPIEKDDAQWAYLISTSNKWRIPTEKFVSTAFLKVGRSVEFSWFRRDPEKFNAMKERLFLTKAERFEASMPSLFTDAELGGGDLA